MKFIHLDRQYKRIESQLATSLPVFFSKGEYILGNVVEKFENKLAEYVSAKYSVGVSSGTDALLITLMSLDIGPGDEIIVPSFTFVSTVEVIVRLGATPVFVDINSNTYNICVDDVQRKINSKTKAIIFVSLYGNLTGIYEIKKIGELNNIVTIEDGAQSFGAKLFNKKSCNILDYSCTSFFPTKPLGCYGDGGAVFTNSYDAYLRISKLRVHGQKVKYYYDEVGIAGRLDALQALILDIKLDILDEELIKRRRIAKVYDIFFDEIGIKRQSIDKNCFSSYGLYTVEFNNREYLLSQFKEMSIPVAVHYPQPIHASKAYLSYFRGPPLSITDEKSTKVLSIPLCPYMEDEEIEAVKKAIKLILSKGG